MALTNIEKVRIELQDTESGLLFLSDDEIQYFLDKIIIQLHANFY